MGFITITGFGGLLYMGSRRCFSSSAVREAPFRLLTRRVNMVQYSNHYYD